MKNKFYFAKTALVLTLLFGSFSLGFSQVKIGDNETTIQPSSLLELESSTKGLLLPRMTTAQRNAISSAGSFVSATSHGLLIYNTDENCVNWWSNDLTSWISPCNPADSITNDHDFYTYNGIPNTRTDSIPMDITNDLWTEGTLVWGDQSNLGGGKNSAVWGNENTVVGSVSLGSRVDVNAMAFGFRNTVSGFNAGVFGQDNTVSGRRSLAFGMGNSVPAGDALVLGNQNVNSGSNSIVTGRRNSSSTLSGIVYGLGDTISGDQMLAGGFNNNADATTVNSIVSGGNNSLTDASYSFVIGQQNVLNGSENSMVAGFVNNVTNDFVAAWGQNNTVSGVRASVGGNGNTVSGANSSVWGQTNTVSGANSAAWGLANTVTRQGSVASGISGRNEADFAAILSGTHDTITSAGFYGFASGNANVLSGSQSGVWGGANQVSGVNAASWGTNNTNAGARSTSFGDQNNITAGGFSALAFGAQNTITGNQSAAWGGQNTVSGVSATAFGNANLVSGDLAMAFGNLDTVSGQRSAAWGLRNSISGANSAIWGVNNKSDYQNSLILGQSNKVQDAVSVDGAVLVTGNNNTISSFDRGIVCGRNHIVTTSGAGTWMESSLLVGINNRVHNSLQNGGMIYGGNANRDTNTVYGIVTGEINVVNRAIRSIVAGIGNNVQTDNGIALGAFNTNNGANSAVWGSNNTLLGNNSSVISGSGLTGTANNTAYADAMVINSGTVGGAAITSDARLKKNVVNNPYGLNTILKLRPVEYDKKMRLASDDYNRHEIGFIAQEIETVIPKIVTKTTNAYNEDILAVDYNSLIPVLTKAIQEQQAQIEELKAMVQALSKDKAQTAK